MSGRTLFRSPVRPTSPTAPVAMFSESLSRSVPRTGSSLRSSSLPGHPASNEHELLDVQDRRASPQYSSEYQKANTAGMHCDGCAAAASEDMKSIIREELENREACRQWPCLAYTPSPELRPCHREQRANRCLLIGIELSFALEALLSVHAEFPWMQPISRPIDSFSNAGGKKVHFVTPISCFRVLVPYSLQMPG